MENWLVNKLYKMFHQKFQLLRQVKHILLLLLISKLRESLQIKLRMS